MDDGRLPVEMSLENIAKGLAAIKEQVTSIDKRLDGIDKRFDGIETNVKAGFLQVNEGLNAAKIRDEEAHSLLKFSLEAREGLRESMNDRFDAMERKQDEDIGLLKDVLRHVTGSRSHT